MDMVYAPGVGLLGPRTTITKHCSHQTHRHQHSASRHPRDVGHGGGGHIHHQPRRRALVAVEPARAKRMRRAGQMVRRLVMQETKRSGGLDTPEG